MTRNLLLAILVTSLAFSGCKKLQLPGAKKQAEAPQQSEAQAAPTAETAEAPADAPAAPPAGVPEAPSAPVIGTKDQVAAAEAKQAGAEPEKKVVVDKNSQVVVLCYHRLEGKAGGQLSIEPALFKEQMQKIKDSGLAVISMKDFIAWRNGEKNIPPKCVLITIDDGYVSSYDVGWPILKEYGYPFTMYVYLKYINVGGKAITWKQLEEMRDAGVDIGSHTISHQDLRRKPRNGKEDYDAWLKDELETSKQTIEEKLGIKVLSIAYPFGLHNEKVRAAVKAAGYEAGFTTYGQRLGHGSDAFALGRYDVTTKDAQGRDSFSVAISFEGMMAPDADPTLSQDAAVSMVTQPMNGEITNDPTPSIKANLSTMGKFDPASVEMRVSGVGLVKAKYDPASKMLSYNVPESDALKPGGYTVIISADIDGRKAETRWSFQVDPNASPSGGADAPLPPRNRGQ